jgi:thioredoxin reductase/Pyruvate/2-oxoacid:ferredoxin oxidoreductase delta subunit
MDFSPIIIIYTVPIGAIWAFYLLWRWRREAKSRATRAAAVEAGLVEPASLHPLFDPAKCLACGACISACPEGRIIGMINGKAELVEPTLCIGHGACREACVYDAITLVFGTEKRGVDIPHVSPDFETNVPGVYIAGELGGMGLVRNAIEQGNQAIESIQKSSRARPSQGYDVIIVGAGPAGFAASLAAMKHKLKFLTIEQDTFGGAVAHYPRGKIVMTAPATLPLGFKLKFRTVSKERLLQVWNDISRKTGLKRKIKYGEEVKGVTRRGDTFEVRTTGGSYMAASVLLAIGRRGTPRKLEVEGEEQSKVVYRMIDPEQYRRQHVLVVGGGDSALEAATSIAQQRGTTVTLSHRGEAFSRARVKNRELVEACQRTGRLKVLFESKVRRIGPDDVEIEQKGKQMRIRNDAVIVCTGGILPTQFLESVGIRMETKYGAP